MKCDLCRDKRMAEKSLCIACGEMICRLLDIMNRLHVREVCMAEQLSCQACAQQSAASGRA